MTISHSILLRMRNVSEKFVGENKTQILCSINFFFSQNRAVYEKMLKNILELDRQQITIWHMRFGCWITKAKDAHLE